MEMWAAADAPLMRRWTQKRAKVQEEVGKPQQYNMATFNKVPVKIRSSIATSSTRTTARCWRNTQTSSFPWRTPGERTGLPFRG